MQNKTIQGIKYWSQLLLLPLYGLSFLMPRHSHIWLFGSTFGRRYADNPRYLFLYASQNKDTIPKINGKTIRPIWISHSKEIVDYLTTNGYEAYTYHSVRGIICALLAKVYVYDNYSKDINFWQSGGAIKLNLWHGSGNKQINHDNIHDRVRHPRNTWERFKTWPRRLSDEKPSDYILATSYAMQPVFASAFAVDINHVYVEGYPRNDVFYPQSESGIKNLYTKQELELREKIQQEKERGRYIIAYLPTFRDSEEKLLEIMDMEAFHRFLTENNLVFVTKLHVKSKIKVQFEQAAKNGKASIINAPADADTNAFLEMSDMLVTDYSSAYTDYMLLERPVVAFQYDREEYERDSRECTIDQDEYMPEVKATNMQELMQAILAVKQQDVRLCDRMKSRKRMFTYIDGQSSKRIVNRVIEELL